MTGVVDRSVKPVTIRAATRQVADDAFESWRPVDDETLLLIAEDRTTGYRVSFSRTEAR